MSLMHEEQQYLEQEKNVFIDAYSTGKVGHR
jgi:hypothetical protein